MRLLLRNLDTSITDRGEPCYAAENLHDNLLTRNLLALILMIGALEICMISWNCGRFVPGYPSSHRYINLKMLRGLNTIYTNPHIFCKVSLITFKG